jgi:hypothetical protein
MSNLKSIIDAYHTEIANLPKLHLVGGGGKARNGSGVIFENLIQRICVDNGLKAKKNDYKRTEEIDGVCLKNLQVDKHIYRDDVMVKAVESKCYLDACYLKRAVIDFIELNSSPDVPNNVEYAIFAGQECVSRDSFNYYLAYFKKMTGKDVNVFIANQFKKRNGSRAIYMEQYNNDFQLDLQEVTRFVEWLNR